MSVDRLAFALQEEGRGQADTRVTVERVVGGVTLQISLAIEGVERVRLIGADTLEAQRPECGEQPYADEASEFTTAELQGQQVDLAFDVERTDRYDRLLAYVYESDDKFNETLLREGYAQVYTVPPNDRYVDRFEDAQAEAQGLDRGVWLLSFDEQAQLTDRGNRL